MTRLARRWWALPVASAIAAVLLLPQPSPAQVTVTGRVVAGETGRSLEGATVTLTPRAGAQPEPQTAQTDAGGRFQWENIPPGQYVVRVEADGYIARTREVMVGEEDVHLALSVLSTPDLSGRVLRPDGKPLARSEFVLTGYVQALSGTHSTGVSPVCRTDEQGRFTVRITEYGRWEVAALAEGLGYAVVPVFHVREGEQPPELAIELRPVSTISGRVVVKGTQEPVAEARIGCHARDDTPNLDFGRASTSDADGWFTVPDVVPGKYRLFAYGQGYQGESVDVEVGEAEQVRDVVIEIVRGADVRGRVLGPDGRTPLANVKVRPSNGRVTETDADGWFTVENVRPGTCRLTVIAEGFAAAKQEIEVAEGEEPAELQIVLEERGGTISGRVIDADAGKPLAEQVVAVLELDEPDPTGIPHQVELFDRQMFDAMGVPEGSPMRTQTKADGTYELTQIPAGTYGVAVIRGRGLNLWKPGVEVREGETTADVDFEIRRKMPGTLAVRVMLPDGRPLANGRVRSSVEHPNGSSSGGNDTDAEGYLYVRLHNPGVYSVQVTLEGYMPGSAELQVDDVAGAPELTVTLEPIPPGGPPAGSLSGHVFMPDGTTPAKGVSVAPFTKDAFFPGANAGYSTGGVTYRMSHQLAVQTDEEGSFTIQDLPPGTYGVYASPRRIGAPPRDALPPELAQVLPTMSDLVEVNDDQVTGDVRVVLGQAGSLLVTVTDAQDGTPIADAQILRSPRGAADRAPFDQFSAHLRTDETGQAQLGGLMPGTCDIRVFAPGYKGLSRQEAVVEAGKETNVEVKLEPE